MLFHVGPASPAAVRALDAIKQYKHGPAFSERKSSIGDKRPAAFWTFLGPQQESGMGVPPYTDNADGNKHDEN